MPKSRFEKLESTIRGICRRIGENVDRVTGTVGASWSKPKLEQKAPIMRQLRKTKNNVNKHT